MNILEIRRAGNLREMEQYLRIKHLEADDKYTAKASIEIGKVMEREGKQLTSRPISFRTDKAEDVLIIIKALIKAYKLMGGDHKMLSYALNKELGKEVELWI